MLIAQISDLHIKPEGKLAYGVVDTAPYLVRAVAWLNALEPQPDVVLATGDLVDRGSPEEYARLREMLGPLRAPVFLIPGNHDARGPLREAFASHAYLPDGGEFLHYVVDGYPLRLIGLDTTIPGKESGQMCDERLAWLDARLAEQPAKPTVIFMHHPPFATGIALMDALGLENGDKMADVVRRHAQVERVLCGHVHRPIQVRWAGTIASVAPSTAHQVTLSFRPSGDHSFVMEPPGVPLLLWRPGTGLIGHLGYPGTYAGPYPFRNASGALL
jgi:3',5'-cyclic-AMP phosphodiesterase